MSVSPTLPSFNMPEVRAWEESDVVWRRSLGFEGAIGLYIPVTGRFGAGATLLSRPFRKAVAGMFRVLDSF